jgi:hypothetical protein
VAAKQRKTAKAQKRVKKSDKTARDEEARLTIAANKAAQEVEDELEQELEEADEEIAPDEEDMRFVNTEFEASSPETLVEKDVFTDGFKKAFSKQDLPKFYIYRNSEFIGIKSHPYSWEKLQKEFGEGIYKVVAKSVSTGQNIMWQSQMVGNPNAIGDEDEVEEVVAQAPTQTTDPLALFSMLGTFQERADSKASQAANQNTAAITAMMTGMMQMQQQASQQFQTMLIEMQKSNQTQLQAAQAEARESNKTMMALVTTLLTQKPQKDDSGFTVPGVMKMMQDAETRAENRVTKQFELIEKKSSELAEIKAEAMSSGGDEGEESLTKTLIKGFMPVMAQVMQAQQAAQPGQVQQAQSAASPHVHATAGRAPGPQSLPPLQQNLPAPISAAEQAQRARQASRPNPQARPVQQRPAPAQARPVQPGPEATSGREQRGGAAPRTARPVEEVAKPLDDQAMLQKFFEITGTDIAAAMTNGTSPEIAAEGALIQLEKSGYARQTVAKVLKLEILEQVADQYGATQEMRNWFKEFHAFIQQKAIPPVTNGAVPGDVAGAAESSGAARSGDQRSPSGGGKPVRSNVSRRAGAQPVKSPEGPSI